MNSLANIVGIDVGGANLKLAAPNNAVISKPFPLWRRPDDLGKELKTLLTEHFASCHNVALTITGELADCYRTRAEGVRRIVQQTIAATPSSAVFVYAVGGTWLEPTKLAGNELMAAASNWHCQAAWVAKRFYPQAANALLVDIGSTTVDIVPLTMGKVNTAARTDRDRLQSGQLVYTGYERTPVSAIVSNVLVDGECCPTMAERFADSADAYIVLGQMQEDISDSDTADGRPKTVQNSQSRLARMVGEDTETLEPSCIEAIAEQVAEAQSNQIVAAATNNLPLNNKPNRLDIMFTGHGSGLQHLVEFKLRVLISTNSPKTAIRFDHLSERLGTDHSRCAPSLAAAELLGEHLGVSASSCLQH